MNEFIPVEHLAVLIPIILIICGSMIPIISLCLRYLRRKRLFDLYHEERMAAINKGVEVPALPDALIRESDHRPKARRPGDTLLKGLVWMFVGLGLFFALQAEHQRESLFALIPAGIGIAYLVYYVVEGRRASGLPPADPNTPTPEALPAKG